MPNRVVIFPSQEHAQAAAYAAACDVIWARNHEPGGTFAYVRPDASGQWVTPYFGPPFAHYEDVPIPEPDELVPLRADGVIHDRPVWPED